MSHQGEQMQSSSRLRDALQTYSSCSVVLASPDKGNTIVKGGLDLF
jgi:hypothetical protein